MTAQPASRPRLLTAVRYEVTPAQLDAALGATGWPTWTGRGDCPLALSDITPGGLERARRVGVTIPGRCLTVGAVSLAERAQLVAALAEVAPGEPDGLSARGLVYVESTPAGEVAYLLGLVVKEG